MPSDKDFKRVVRARMQHTGESYTAARAILLQQPRPRRADAPRPAARVPTPDLASLAGMSDQAVKASTGCTWDRWVWSLDRVEAHTWPHPRIARYIQDTWKATRGLTVTLGLRYSLAPPVFARPSTWLMAGSRMASTSRACPSVMPACWPAARLAESSMPP